jgi:[ribosomal protein S5]-alanine N-acetyltransferase
MSLRLFAISSRRPSRLSGYGLTLRFPEHRDYPHWQVLRQASAAFLMPWEPRWPDDDLTSAGFRRRLRRYRQDADQGSSYTWLVTDTADGALYGGITLSNIRLGVSRSGQIGYWMGEEHAGRGIMKKAVFLVLDMAFSTMGLERIEAACLPQNTRSFRLLEALGFRKEGIARSYLEINGERRDHALYAILKSDFRAKRPVFALQMPETSRSVAG